MKQLIVNRHPDITFMYMCKDVTYVPVPVPRDLNLHKPVWLYKLKEILSYTYITVHVHLYVYRLTCTRTQLKMIRKNMYAIAAKIPTTLIEQ